MKAFPGYARVITTGQNLNTQLGVTLCPRRRGRPNFTDKVSGAVNADRPGLSALLHHHAPRARPSLAQAEERVGAKNTKVTNPFLVRDLCRRSS